MSDRSLQRRRQRQSEPSTVQQSPAPAAETPSVATGGGHSFATIDIHAPAAPALQTKLTVNAPGDVFEQEADRVADQVMRMADPSPEPVSTGDRAIQRCSACGGDTPPDQPLCPACAAAQAGAGETAEIQTMRDSFDITASEPAAARIQRAVDATHGGGQTLDAATRAFMEPRFGRNFSGVRVHTHSDAAVAARSINAAAYTIGNDIAFGEGRYQPGTDSGKRLLAHELTHVVQQTGGVAGNSQIQAAPLGVQRAVETLGGTWDTDKYEKVVSGGKEIGVEIDRLRFKAKDPVDATKIGLTQMVNSINQGSVVALNDTVKSRSIPSGETDAGSHIDRLHSMQNPIYGMADPTGKNPTLGSSVTTGNSAWGKHFKDAAGAVQHEDATLYDQPTLPSHGANASQIFETAALAVEGPQANTFYGTVRWGWQSDPADANKIVKLPLSVVSVGVPTATFKRSTELWNAGKTSTGADTLDLPIAAGSAGTMLPSQMSDSQIEARLNQIKDEIKNAPAGQTTQTLEFERNALDTEWRQRHPMGDFPLPEQNPDTAMA